MKLVKIFAVLGIIVLLSVWLIGRYLGPDDLSGCAELKPSTDTNCGPADVIVAVSGGDTNARVDEAIRLYKLGWAPTLIFSGAAADKSGPSNAAVMKQRAINAGVVASAIIVEELSESTDQNAKQTTSIFIERGLKNAIIVTSPYHQRRAMLEFERRAPSVTIRAHPTTSDTQWSAWWWLTPNGWWVAIAELGASLALSIGVVGR